MRKHASKLSKYKHIFIDLDRTIWDFERNARETFMEIYHKHQLFKHFEGFESFYDHYKEYNDALWQLYREGEIKKDNLSWKRFLLTLKEGGISDEKLARQMSDEYISIGPEKRKLFPHALSCLMYLSKQYNLNLITNGFSEVQYRKIENAKIGKFFDNIITSEDVGSQKPKEEFFTKMLEVAGAKKNNSVVIGDDIVVDILGAHNAGIDQIWFNPNRKKFDVVAVDLPDNVPTIEINHLRDLIHLF